MVENVYPVVSHTGPTGQVTKPRLNIVALQRELRARVFTAGVNLKHVCSLT